MYRLGNLRNIISLLNILSVLRPLKFDCLVGLEATSPITEYEDPVLIPELGIVFFLGQRWKSSE